MVCFKFYPIGILALNIREKHFRFPFLYSPAKKLGVEIRKAENPQNQAVENWAPHPAEALRIN